MGKLLEVFKDIEVTVEGKALSGRYKTLCRIEPRADPKKNPKKITVEDLKAYAKSLNSRFKDRLFYVCLVGREGLRLHVLDQLPFTVEPVEELRAKFEALENEIIALSQEIEDVEESSKGLREAYERCRAEIQKIERRHWFIRWIFKFKARKLTETLVKLESDIKPFDERLNSLKAKLADLQAQKEALNKQIEADGKKETQGRLPIYFDVEGQRAFVDEDDYNREPKLSNYLLMVTLGALGLSQVKYERILGRAEGEA